MDDANDVEPETDMPLRVWSSDTLSDCDRENVFDIVIDPDRDCVDDQVSDLDDCNVACDPVADLDDVTACVKVSDTVILFPEADFMTDALLDPLCA